MFDSIRSGIEIFNNVTYQNVGSLIAHGFDEYDDALFISSLSDQFSEELHIIDHVYEMQLNLDSTTLLGYTNQVMDIVNTAYVDHQISDSSAWLINASVSTLAHTRLLWKSYLPDYRLTTLYMAYIDDYSKWVLCNKSQLEYLSSHYHVTNVGIPSVIDGKCSEIFFFPSSTFFYGVNNTHFQHLFADDGFDIYESTSFERMVSNYTNHFFDNMTVGHRHVRSVPNENGITYVSFVEE